MNLEQYQKFIIYNDFFKQNENKTLADIKINIEEINNNCLNKNFIFILIFEQWIKTYSYIPYIETATSEIFYKSVPFYTILELNFFPFEKINVKAKTATDIFPVFDISNIIDIFNNLKIVKSENNDPTKKIKNIYKFINENINQKKIKPNIHRYYYINKPARKIEEANDGLFIQLIKMLNPEILKEVLTKKNKRITGKEIFEKLLIDIEEIKKIKKSDLTSLTICISKENKIKEISNKIISIFQTIFSTTNSLYNIIYTSIKKTQDEEFTLSIEKKDLQESPKFTIEQLLNSLKQKIVPQFKKAYVTRENNLTAFIEIKMLYHVKNKNENEFIQINNFNIPYNNIISLEHNVNDQKITINLIDTEGELSELLILKMYNVTTQIAQSKKINNVDIEDSLPYIFEIEYGWACPKTEIEEQLLEEKVYVKKKFRGYIRSISSQFSNKGTQYTLEIMPINYENNFFNGNYYDILYNNQSYRQESSFAVSLFVLYFVLKYWNDDESLDDSKSPEGTKSSESFNKETFVLEKIFFLIKYYNVSFFKTGGNSSNRYYEIAFTSAGKKKGKILTNRINEKKDIDLIELLLKNVDSGDDNDYEISKIGSENMKLLSSAHFEFSLNAWLVAVFLIWNFNFYFIGSQKFYLFHDTTGLFDFFNDDAEYGKKKNIDKEKFYDIINKFNVFCFEENNPPIIDDYNFFIKMKEIIKNETQRNQYQLYSIYDNKASSKDTNRTRKLTFFNTKIQEIFKQIVYVGYNKDYDDNNVYQFSSGINSDFATYQDSDIRYYLEILNDYKKKIYANKIFIYQPSLVSDKREEDNFIIFYNNFKKTILDLAVMNKDNNPYTSNLGEGEDEKKIKELLENDKVNKYITKGDVNIFYLSYGLEKSKIIGSKHITLEKKISFLSKSIMQSYSLMPRIYPKTRNSNKQFFSQGNDNLLNEGTGDIIEFSPIQFSVGTITSLNKQMENLLNVNFDDFFNQSYVNSMHENAAKYYNTYINIDGKTNKNEILKNMAQIKLNYQNQINVKADITIIGEPFWSNVDFVNRSIFIYLNIYHNSGLISDYTGLYTVENIVQNIDNGKFTTKMNLVRVPTFLNNFASADNQTIMMDNK